MPLSSSRSFGRARSCETRSPRRRRVDPESARARRADAPATARSSRPPIAVTVRSIVSSSEPARPPSAPSTTLRWRSVTGSIEQRVGGDAQRDVADVRQLAALRLAQVGDDGAGGRRRPPARRRGRSRRATPCGAARSSARAGARGLERPGLDARDARDASGAQRAVDLTRCRATSSSRGRRIASSAATAAAAPGPSNSRGRELAGRDVEERQAPGRGRDAGGRDRGEKRGLARLEVRRVGERAGRDDARDLAPDDALGLARILDLIADRDAIALADEPRRGTCRRAWKGTPHIGIAAPAASFARDVSVSSSTREAVSASS